MTEIFYENNGVSASPNSYVLIRIKKLMKTMEHGGDNKKKPLVSRLISKNSSFDEKVGSMFNNVIGKKNSMDETETETESENVDDTASDESELAEVMKKVELMLQNILKKIMVDTSGKRNLNDGVRVRGQRTAYSRAISKKFDMQLKKVKVHDRIVMVLEQRGLRLIRRPANRKFRSSWWMKMMGGEKQIELCKKKILMGMRCRPLSVSGKLQYDKNGLLIPENIP